VPLAEEAIGRTGLLQITHTRTYHHMFGLLYVCRPSYMRSLERLRTKYAGSEHEQAPAMRMITDNSKKQPERRGLSARRL
jgi:hypothetical protein